MHIMRIKNYAENGDFFLFILIYCILLFFSGFYFFESETAIGLLVVGVLLIFAKNKLKISLLKSKVVVILIINILSTELLGVLFLDGQFQPKVITVYILNIIFALFLSSKYGGAEFYRIIDIYIDCMILISLASLFLFLVSRINFNIITFLPSVISTTKRVGYYAVFSIVSDTSYTGAMRNQGIFWEPGAFQAFLSLAYIWETTRRNRFFVLVLFLVSIVTTYSTTGFIVGLLLAIYSLGTKTKNKNLQIVLLFVIAAIGLSGVLYILPRLTGYWKFAIYDKIHNFVGYKKGVETASSTRVRSIIEPLYCFLESPLLGIGEAGYSMLPYKTCTPINLFVRYGPIYGIFFVAGFWKGMKRLTEDSFKATLTCILFFLSTFSEALEFNIIILAFSIWGMVDRRKEFVENEKNEYWKGMICENYCN